jgi:chaperonin GroES
MALSRAIHPAPAAADPPFCRPQVNEGLVVAVGPGRRTSSGEIIPPSVKEGDKVLLPEYGGHMLKLDSKE